MPVVPTRPELAGTLGMVSSTHWLASAVGQSVLERGGTAFDAAAAAGFALQVLEPHLNGPGGEVPVVCQPAGGEVAVVCGQGVTPAAATGQAFADLGLADVPGTGLLAATVPGAFGAWALLVERWGTWSVADVLEPAIALADGGVPVLPRVSAVLAGVAGHFAEHWPTSAATYLVGEGAGGVPVEGGRLRLPGVAATYRRLVAEAGTGPRERQWARARDAWYRGFVAAEIDAFCATTSWLDTSGRAHGGLLRADDLAAWEPVVEPPATLDYRGVEVCKTRQWGQGPVMLAVLGVLEALGVGDLGPAALGCEADGRDDPQWLHAWAEATKLAMADREAWYGDAPGASAGGGPSRTGDSAVPGGRARHGEASARAALAEGRARLLADLLDPAYLARRAALVGDEASAELRPGSPGGRTPRLPARVVERWGVAAAGAEHASAADALSVPMPGSGEPTVDRAGLTRGDTVHLDVVDRWGNVVAATPSGGWLQSSPVVPALGFPLGTRAQMAWLEPGLPSSLEPRVRPRTTLSPTLLRRDGRPWLALGTPGGDQQDQWSTVLVVRAVAAAEHASGRNPARPTPLQQLVDAPMLHSEHQPSSFHPRQARPRALVVEDRFAGAGLDELGRRGHLATTVDGWSLGRLCVVGRELGWLRAAANSRGAQGYAAGR